MRTILIALAFVAGCQTQPHVPGKINQAGEVVATVNGQPLHDGVFDVMLAQFPEAQRAEVEKMRGTQQFRDTLDQQGFMVLHRVYNDALAANAYADPDIQAQVAFAERMALVEAFIKEKTKAAVTEEDLKKAYDERQVQFVKEEVNAKHILLSDEATANAVMEELKGGADFTELAKSKSIDPSAQVNGGDLGWFSRAQMIPEFSDAAFGAEKGALVGPVKSQFGYHVILVVDKKTETTSFEDAKATLREQLEQEAGQKIMQEYKDSTEVVWTKPVEGAELPAGAVPSDAVKAAAEEAVKAAEAGAEKAAEQAEQAADAAK